MPSPLIMWWLTVRRRRRRRSLLFQTVLLTAMKRLLFLDRDSAGRQTPLFRPLTRWYSNVFVPSMTADEFRRHFRVPLHFYRWLCETIHIPPSSHQQQQLPLFLSLQIFLYRLATGSTARELSTTFGVSESSVTRSTRLVLPLLIQHLRNYISFPSTPAELAAVSHGFQHLRADKGFENVVGAIDGSHIRLERRPSRDGNSFFNRKQFYSILLQAVVDSNGEFINVNIGWPGSAHDARVLRTSDIHRDADRLIPPPYFLIGDSGYPLKRWLITTFKTPRNPQQNVFNAHLSSMRVVVEQAFGRLKGRWRWLQQGLNCSSGDWHYVVFAAALLHNACERHKDRWQAVDDVIVEEGNVFVPQSREGGQIRNAIAASLVAE